MEQNATKYRSGYRWVVFAVSVLMVAVCLGFCSGTKGLFKVPIANALLNGDRGALSINDSIRYISTAAVNLFFGTLVAKFGPRKLVAAGFISLILSMVLYALAENLILIYLGGMFLGMGLSWTTTTMVGYVIRKWFRENTGTVMGFVLAANGIGGAVATQIVAPIIDREGDLFSYREAYWLTAAVLVVVGVIVVAFFRDRKDVAAQKSKKEITEASKTAFRSVSRTKTFYLVAACVFLTGFALQSVSGTAVAHMTDVGLSAEFRTWVLTLYSIFLAVFKFLTGVSRDKFGLRKTVLICDLAAVVMIAVLVFLDTSPVGQALTVLYNVFIPAAMPLETIILPFIAAEMFGEEAYAKALGVLVSINTAGYALGPPCADIIYDSLGTYRPVFVALSLLMLVVCVTMQILLLRKEKAKN